ncbi:MAG: glycosyltransferase family 1 protein, partial [Clostridiaceae bacterium]
SVIMNYYRAIDKTQIQFDFFVHETSSFPQRAEIEQLGGRYFLTPPYSSVFKYQKTLTRLLRENQYYIVHSHINTLNVFSLFAAFLAGVPVRICHNHSTVYWGERGKALIKYILRPLAKIFATEYFACGEKAGRWFYGDRRFQRGKVQILPNAIDPERYQFDIGARETLRAEYGIAPDTLVVGHVGRFTYAKNHTFLLDVFAALHKEQPDSVLLLAGEGELEPQIRMKAQALDLNQCVRFLGVRDDVNKLYSAMDVFFLPSHFEGMPVVLVEAQASGLPCVISDRVTDEMKSEHLIQRLAGSESIDAWVQALISARRTERKSGVRLAEYDISIQAERLTRYYLSKRGFADE